MTDLNTQARTAFETLRANSYPGRGMVLGRSPDGSRLLQLYWIMGRSANSRNRQFIAEDATLRTEAVDPAALEDPTLVIYTAMDRAQEHHVVTNGDHTDTVIAALHRGHGEHEALAARMHEPDPPNNTPRIAGGLALRKGGLYAWLAIVRADPFDAGRSVRGHYSWEDLPAGMGYGITTYQGDGAPLPSFSGEPLLLPITGTGDALLADYWSALHADNRVALALKEIDPVSGECTILVRNQYGPTARP